MSSDKVPNPQRKSQLENGSIANSTDVGPSPKRHIIIDNVHIQYGSGKERLPSAVALHGETFKTDPAIKFLLHDFDREARTAYIPEYIGTLLGGAAVNGAIFDEAWTTEPVEDSNVAPSCSAVWLPPGRKMDNWRTYVSPGMFRMLRKVGISGIMRALGDFQSCANKAKKKGLNRPDGSGRLVQFHYLFFISTTVDARGKGLASKVIGRFQEEVRKEGKNIPIWLEATTEKSMHVYERVGFEHVDSWVLGRGKVNADGEPSKDGEGVRIWGMVWWPHPGTKSSSASSNGALSGASSLR